MSSLKRHITLKKYKICFTHEHNPYVISLNRKSWPYARVRARHVRWTVKPRWAEFDLMGKIRLRESNTCGIWYTTQAHKILLVSAGMMTVCLPELSPWSNGRVHGGLGRLKTSRRKKWSSIGVPSIVFPYTPTCVVPWQPLPGGYICGLSRQG
jgi:hypothetical protein